MGSLYPTINLVPPMPDESEVLSVERQQSQTTEEQNVGPVNEGELTKKQKKQMKKKQKRKQKRIQQKHIMELEKEEEEIYNELTTRMQTEEKQIMFPRSRSVPFETWNDEQHKFVMSKEEIQTFQYEINYYINQRNQLYLRYEAEFKKEREKLEKNKQEKIKQAQEEEKKKVTERKERATSTPKKIESSSSLLFGEKTP